MKTEHTHKGISVYCGTYGKYANGSIDGEWIDLCQFSDIDEFLARCRTIHADESDPEFMFQDVNNYTDLPIHGEPGISDIVRFIDFLQLADYDQDILAGYVEIHGWQDDVEDTLEKATDAYCGNFESMTEYAEQAFSECYEIPDHLANYIDWEAVARDFKFDHTQASNGNIYRDY